MNSTACRSPPTRPPSIGAGAAPMIRRALRSLFAAQKVIQIVRRPSLGGPSPAAPNSSALPERRLRRAVPRLCCPGARADAALQHPADRGGRAGLSSDGLARTEYEVARLHADAAFAAKIGEMFDGGEAGAPLRAADPGRETDAQGRPVGPGSGRGCTRRCRGWLAKLKFLRGTAFDLRPHRGAPHRACADPAVPCQRRGAAGAALEGAAGHGGRDRPAAAGDRRLRACEGGESGEGAGEVAGADGRLARRAFSAPSASTRAGAARRSAAWRARPPGP